jgi:periplasmic protein TonB
MFATPKRSALLSWLLHCGAILLILAVTGAKPKIIPLIHEVLVAPADFVSYKPLVKSGGSGGGGGGVHANTAASLGKLPEFARFQISPPVVKIDNTTPILPVEPTLIGDADINLATFDYANFGVPNGVVGRPSGGPGIGGGIGDGHGRGVGPGQGPGYGPGEGGGTGGGEVGYLGAGGGAISAPTVIFKAEPEYSEDARKAKLQGTVRLQIEVDTHGLAQHIVINQSLGLGLDERAVDAVKKWRFNPGKVNGKPVTVIAFVDVNFRLL